MNEGSGPRVAVRARPCVRAYGQAGLAFVSNGGRKHATIGRLTGFVDCKLCVAGA